MRLSPGSPIPALGSAADLKNSELGGLLLDHFYRGARIQRVLRLALVAFFVATLIAVPPSEGRLLSWVIVLAYAVWAVVVGGLVRLASLEVATYVWLALLVDVLAASALTLVADSSADVTWTAYVVVNGFFLIPVLAAAQLNAWVCGLVSGIAVLGYFGASVATREANDSEPWSVLLLRVFLLAVIGLGCVGLSRLQRRRVAAIGSLAEDRRRLVAELVDVQQRERSDLAEHLHDGALQYVLAARQDLEDVGDDPVAQERIDHALGQAVQLLRSTLTQLHPAVVQEAGLLAALRDLVEDLSRRTTLEVALTSQGWEETTRTSVDALLLGAARELLANVVKHAHASSVEIALTLTPTGRDPEVAARLVVTDDGVGLADTDLSDRLAAGHLGLASRRIHVEAVGGSMLVEPAGPAGTRVEITAPASLL